MSSTAAQGLVLEAKRGLLELLAIAEAIDTNNVARSAIHVRLFCIDRALKLARKTLGMPESP